MDARTPQLRPDALSLLPKVELHVHLEGSVRPLTFLQLARKNKLDVQCQTEQDVLELFRFRDFRHFMELYGACTYAFKHPEDFELVTKELGIDASAQGVRYMEVTFTAGTHHRFKGMPFNDVMNAIYAGAQAAKAATGVEMRFIIDHVRGFPLADCFQTAEWCVEGRDRGVVALGLAGFEPGHPASDYAPAIEWAAEQGVAFVPHAGEAVGPEGVWDALRFNPARIGHGFRASEDPVLIDELRRRQVLLELCPTSNLRTGVAASLSEYPLRQLWDSGVPVLLNTDDPHMFNTSLLNEYRLAVDTFGFTLAELAQMNLSALRATLLSEAERQKLADQFIAELHMLGIRPDKQLPASAP